MNLACRLGIHRPTPVAITLSIWPRHHGYTDTRCARCGRLLKGGSW